MSESENCSASKGHLDLARKQERFARLDVADEAFLAAETKQQVLEREAVAFLGVMTEEPVVTSSYAEELVVSPVETVPGTMMEDNDYCSLECVMSLAVDSIVVPVVAILCLQ